VFALLVANARWAGFVGVVQSLILLLLTILVLVYILKKQGIAVRNTRILPLCAALGVGIGMLSAMV
jgi:hypothetical protein